jgi:hypothetical protein
MRSSQNASRDVTSEGAETLRDALDCSSAATMRDVVVRTNALHRVSSARVLA